jgi:hypothetical protein
LNIQNAFEKGTRSKDGKPGENYWQNSADYDITIRFDPYGKTIEGSESIKYFNNSPDSLSEIVIRLYQNFYKANSSRNFQISAESITDGVTIKDLKIRGEKVNLENRSRTEFTNTNLIVRLDKKIPPESNVEITIDWKHSVPGGRPIRTGIYDSTTFFIAYWYPQIAVYDDIDGWDKIDFNGEQEMYNDFNSYNVKIEVPNKFGIWATGVLQNPEEVLDEKILLNFNSAKSSEEVVHIIAKDDYLIGNVFRSDKETNTWHYKADYVSDFAFGSSNFFLWDGVSMTIKEEDDRKIFISTAYNPESPDFHQVAQVSKDALVYFSTDLPGIPYPYPSFTAFNGGGGMEFPMIINDESNTTLAGTVGLTSHEAAHTYFPFYMGTNEKKYAWMDEGMAVMLPFKFQEQVEGNDPLGRNVGYYLALAGKEMEMPPIIPSNLLRSSSYRVASYSRPGIAYQYLQDLLGRDVFRNALQEYMNRWKGKHPIPNDFFNSFEDHLGMDLSWYWNPWFFEKGYPDLGIKNVVSEKGMVKVLVEKVGNIPAPIDLTFIGVDQNEFKIYRDASIWEKGIKEVWIELEYQKQLMKVKLGSVKIPDVDQSNNLFILK